MEIYDIIKLTEIHDITLDFNENFVHLLFFGIFKYIIYNFIIIVLNFFLIFAIFNNL